LGPISREVIKIGFLAAFSVADRGDLRTTINCFHDDGTGIKTMVMARTSEEDLFHLSVQTPPGASLVSPTINIVGAFLRLHWAPYYYSMSILICPDARADSSIGFPVELGTTSIYITTFCIESRGALNIFEASIYVLVAAALFISVA
jgi:hypothetical protein